MYKPKPISKEKTTPTPQTAGNEFFSPKTKPTGGADFNEVIARLPLGKLYLPKDFTIAQKIHQIVSNKEATSAQQVYDALASLKTEDLRPHLLLLLKGFKADDKNFSITKALFETLHTWVEFTQSSMHSTQKVQALTLQQGIPYLRLSNEQTSKLQENIQSTPTSQAQKTVFFIPLDDMHIQQRANYAIQKITYSLDNKEKTSERIDKNNYDILIYNRLLANIKFLNQFAEIYQMGELKTIVKKLETWMRDVSQYLNGPQNINDFPIFPCTRRELLALFLHKAFGISQDVFVSTTVMTFEYHPLMDYQYDKTSQTWFFISLSARMYQWYFEVTQQKNNMVFCYGPISAKEMTWLFLQQKPRLGNLTHYEPLRDHYKANVFHNEHQEFVAAAFIHDNGHKHISSQIATSKLPSILINWVRLIGDKTKLYTKFGPEDTSIPFTAETWYITDQAFPEVFLAKNTLEMLSVVFHNISMHLRRSPIARCMLILDMLLSDRYYGLAKTDESLPYALRQIEAHREHIIKVFNALCKKNVPDPFIIASIGIFAMVYTEASAHFTAEDLVNYSAAVSYTWQKAKPGNQVQLHAGLPDQKLKEGPDDKNVHINSFIL